MEPFGLVVIVVGIAAVAAVIWWFARRRRADMLEYDEAPAADEPVDAPPQVLSRDALINPNRHLDPTKWDLPGDDDIEGELPTHFDRALPAAPAGLTAPADGSVCARVRTVLRCAR